MMRTKLLEALRGAFDCQVVGGFIANINKEEIALPMVWLNPLTLSELTGYGSGTSTYNVSFYVMESIIDPQTGKAYTEDRKFERWDLLEQKARRALGRLRREGFDVDGITISPDELSLTGYGEVSVEVEGKIVTNYCDEDTD